MHNGRINLPLEEGFKGHGELLEQESCWPTSLTETETASSLKEYHSDYEC